MPGERVRNGSMVKLRRGTFERLRLLKAYLQRETGRFDIAYSDILDAVFEGLGENGVRELFKRWLERRGKP